MAGELWCVVSIAGTAAPMVLPMSVPHGVASATAVRPKAADHFPYGPPPSRSRIANAPNVEPPVAIAAAANPIAILRSVTLNSLTLCTRRVSAKLRATKQPAVMLSASCSLASALSGARSLAASSAVPPNSPRFDASHLQNMLVPEACLVDAMRRHAEGEQTDNAEMMNITGVTIPSKEGAGGRVRSPGMTPRGLARIRGKWSRTEADASRCDTVNSESSTPPMNRCLTQRQRR
jgi:hypothetical protein